MTNLIIWSKDRACQLHLLLESLEKYSGNTFSKVFIIYTHSSKAYSDAYISLRKRFTKPIFIEESSFYNDTMRVLNENATNIAFSTDDNVCFDSFNLSYLSLKNEVFSLRLGLNTLIQNHIAGTMQIPLNRYVSDGDLISWNHLDFDPMVNYGYPCSLDMHIFNREKMLNIVKQFSFKNTNELESNLVRFRFEFSSISAFRSNKIVNIPCNNMSNYTQINLNNKYTTESLNSMYLKNYVISLPLLRKHRVIGCHQDIPYTLVKYG